MRPRFVVTNVVVAALAYAAWRFGVFTGFPALGRVEIVMVGFLAAYAALGAAAAFMGNWRTCAHIANSLPMWALTFTGLGLVLAVADLHSLTPEAMAVVFRNLAYSIIPNIVGVALMAWLRELAWWCARAEV
ncbi:MAG TPA: hypothetical protein VIJ55_05465 [Acetobacteraceae bacterium]